MEETALIEVEKLDIVKLFSQQGMEEALSRIEARAKEFVPVLDTEADRKEIASMAYKVARSKTLIDDIGKETQAEWKKKVDEINKYRKVARDRLDVLKIEVRQPLTEWEAEEKKRRQEKIAAEEKRVQIIRENIEGIKKEAIFDPGTPADKLQKRLQELQSIHIAEDRYQEFTAEARACQTESSNILANALDKAIAWEAEQHKAKEEAARLEKIRKEQEEEAARFKAIADEQAAKQKAIDDEKAKFLADLKAEQERKDREEFERKAKEDAKIAAEKAEKERVEREEADRKAKAKAEAEEAARQEALRPDKEKLSIWANSLLDIVSPELSNEKSRKLASRTLSAIYQVARDLLKDLEGL